MCLLSGGQAPTLCDLFGDIRTESGETIETFIAESGNVVRDGELSAAEVSVIKDHHGVARTGECLRVGVEGYCPGCAEAMPHDHCGGWAFAVWPVHGGSKGMDSEWNHSSVRVRMTQIPRL